MSSQYLTGTMALCVICGRLIPAQVQILDGAVWMHKHCPDHGAQSARIYSDAEQYLGLGRFHRAGSIPLQFATAMDKGCPDSCGLCPEHEQHVCMPIIEITDDCDMACPICLVKPRSSYRLTPEQVSAMLDRLIASEGQIDVLNVSGGEPTLHPQFRQIVEQCLSRKEILYVSVSTNGLNLCRDESLLRLLADRHVIISLQFDGEGEGPQHLRGQDLHAEKMRLIDRIGELGGRMSLTMTVVRGFNEDQIYRPVELLFEHPHILSVMYQPMAYVGRGAAIQRPEDAITIPDVIRGLDGARGDLISIDDFSPLPCSHPACFSLAFYLRVEGGDFIPIRRLLNTDRYLDMVQNRAIFGTDAESFATIQDALYELWSGPAGLAPDSQKAMSAVRSILDAVNANRCYCARTAMAAAEGTIKSIFIHHFMDRHTFDLSRARKCCQVYPQPDGRLMPACVYNCLRR